MARPSRSDEKRREFLPLIAKAFAELGYRRATTAELAARCGVRENVLYRIWPDKKAMFLASIDFVFDYSRGAWAQVLGQPSATAGSAAERLLAYESEHHGETGLYRLIFAGLSETDDPDIRDALRRMYEQFQRFIEEQIATHRDSTGGGGPDATLSAWAVVGLGTVNNIIRELELLPERKRQRMLRDVGRLLMDGRADT